jgi:hypothetical protein
MLNILNQTKIKVKQNLTLLIIQIVFDKRNKLPFYLLSTSFIVTFTTSSGYTIRCKEYLVLQIDIIL